MQSTTPKRHAWASAHLMTPAPVVLLAGRYQVPAPGAVRIDLDMAAVCRSVAAAMHRALRRPRYLALLRRSGPRPELLGGRLDGARDAAADVLDLVTAVELDHPGALRLARHLVRVYSQASDASGAVDWLTPLLCIALIWQVLMSCGAQAAPAVRLRRITFALSAMKFIE